MHLPQHPALRRPYVVQQRSVCCRGSQPHCLLPALHCRALPTLARPIVPVQLGVRGGRPLVSVSERHEAARSQGVGYRLKQRRRRPIDRLHETRRIALGCIRNHHLQRTFHHFSHMTITRQERTMCILFSLLCNMLAISTWLHATGCSCQACGGNGSQSASNYVAHDCCSCSVEQRRRCASSSKRPRTLPRCQRPLFNLRDHGACTRLLLPLTWSIGFIVAAAVSRLSDAQIIFARKPAMERACGEKQRTAR